MTDTGEPAPLQTVGDRYVLVEAIAADARHEVWRGHDDLASRPVVITRFLETTDEWRATFDRRARALEAITDPGIASVLRHDADDEPPWLATAWIEGETVAALAAEAGLTVDDALAVIGQTAFALAAAHSAGVGHGSLDADHVMVRPDGSVALVGFAVAASPPTAADLTSLSALADAVVRDDTGDADVARFLSWLAGNGIAAADDAREIGRTALALAAARRTGAGAGAGVVPRTEPAEAEAAATRRPWYDDAERKRVRNRLIALGAIVVLGGAALLRIFASGGGQATVPGVIGIPYVQAQHQLNEVGFRTSDTETTGPVGSVGTVIAQDPPGGTRAKVGTLVRLTVVTTESQ